LKKSAASKNEAAKTRNEENFVKIKIKNMPNKNFKKAYSLIELSIVILIISILITGALSVSVNSINNAKIKVTNDRIAEIYKAIGAYLLANNQLPCPASIIKVKGVDSTYGQEVACESAPLNAGAGIYQSATSGELYYGAIPANALGLSNEMMEDGFGSKFVYIVNYKATTPTVIATPTVGFGGTGMSQFVQVQDKGSVTTTLTSTAVIAIISYGANKAGAFNATSTSQNTRSTDTTDEQDNDATAFDTVAGKATFNNNLISVSSGNDTFDDVVFFKTRNAMMQDFNAFSSVIYPCQADSEALYETTITWPAATYDQNISDDAQCPVGYQNGPYAPIKKCGAFGVWGSVISACS
jgi:prepilin-type N-terminal cleavage/methylation domain-containing protein